MGAGDTPAGAAPAGIDPPAAFSPPCNVRPPQALRIQGATLDVPLTAQGLYAGTDPVDHRVALAIFATLGSIPSAPEIGSTLLGARIADPQPLQQEVEARVRTALQDEIAAQNINLLQVTATVSPRWRLSVLVVYQNLRLPGAPQRRLSLP